MRTLIVGLLLVSTSTYGHPSFELIARIEQDKITESSGLARSNVNPGIFWTMNDDSEPRLYAFDAQGQHRGRLTLDPASNRDWEDLASFKLNGKAYLLVADVGDNAARRDSVQIYIVDEPDLKKDDKVRSEPAWTIDVTFPEGPRDVESVAVDIANNEILLLTKRTIPAVLYSVPLRPDSASVVATRLGEITSLPPPSKRDRQMARKLNDWWWQPSAMDIHGRHAVITTYRAAFVFERAVGESWLATLNGQPSRISLGGIRDVEAVAISADARSLFVTTEGDAPPLLRSELPWKTVSVMSFNVENLFDTQDDAGKDDKTFLPLAKKQDKNHIEECNAIEVDRWRSQCLEWDWNETVLEVKLQRIADAILQVDAGHGADIVALQEIENLVILERLRTEYLASAGYQAAILIEGQDLRGLDVAFLSRLPLAGEPVLHPLQFPEAMKQNDHDARGVLQAEFELPGGGILTGFSVHFPAPFHPTPLREIAYRQLLELQSSLPDGRPAFAAGDFNTTSIENAREDLLGRFVRDNWTVAHEVGCSTCTGTSYSDARRDWSFLDMILWSPGSDWKIIPEAVELPNAAPEQSRRLDSGVDAPRRFDVSDASGVSDHFPVLMRIARQASPQKIHQ